MSADGVIVRCPTCGMREHAPDQWCNARGWRFRPPHSARLSRVMNLAARLDLPWDADSQTWSVTNSEHAVAMRNAGAEEA